MSDQPIAYFDGQSLFCPACVEALTAKNPDLLAVVTTVNDVAHLPEAEPPDRCYECSGAIG